LFDFFDYLHCSEIRFRDCPVEQLPELMAVYDQKPSVVEKILLKKFREVEVKKVHTI